MAWLGLMEGQNFHNEEEVVWGDKGADSIYSTAGEFDIWGELINFSAFGWLHFCLFTAPQIKILINFVTESGVN